LLDTIAPVALLRGGGRGERNANSYLLGVAYDPAGFWWSVGNDTADSLTLRIPSR